MEIIQAKDIHEMNAKAQQWVEDNIPDNWDDSMGKWYVDDKVKHEGHPAICFYLDYIVKCIIYVR